MGFNTAFKTSNQFYLENVGLPFKNNSILVGGEKRTQIWKTIGKYKRGPRVVRHHPASFLTQCLIWCERSLKPPCEEKNTLIEKKRKKESVSVSSVCVFPPLRQTGVS